MEKTFIIESFTPDSHGDVIMPGAFKDLPKKVLLTKDFNHNNPLGEVEVIMDGDKLIAKGNIDDLFDNFYPAIGFQLLKYTEENGVKVISEAKLHYVGLCANPNLDNSIKTIGEQTKGNN